MARGQVGAHQQGVDPGRVPAQHHVLVGVRKNLRLHEIAGREQLGKRGGLAHVAHRVGEKLLGAMLEIVAHACRVDIDAVGGGYVKMLRQLLQPEALELAARDIVVLGKDPGVDDAAAADVVAAVCD